jgi:hypothetical protein
MVTPSSAYKESAENHNVTPILMQLFDLYVEVTYLHFNSIV